MAGRHGFGARLFLGNPVTLLEIAEITSVTPPSPTTETVDATSHQSPGGWREFIAGLIDGGEGTIALNWLAGSPSDTALSAMAVSRLTRPFRVNVPGATVSQDITGNCIVTAYERDGVSIDDKMASTVTIRTTGPITVAAGT